MTLAIPARMLRAAWIVVLVCACVAGPALAADAGWLAYERGDYAAARNFYDAAARAGDRLAQYNLAMMLMRGEGGTADAGAGVVWLRRAADAGMAQAQYNLGLLFESGVGVPRSLTSATTWWEKAAEQGHADAQVQLATQYFLGRGAPKDWKLAARWYEAAAGNGDAGAQYIIGSFYEHGDGVAQDLRKALDWYAQAARQGDIGMRGMPVDDEVRVRRVRVHARCRRQQPAGRVRHDPGEVVAHPRHLVLAHVAANRLRCRGLLKHLMERDLEALALEVGESIQIDLIDVPGVNGHPDELLAARAGLEPVEDHPLHPQREPEIVEHLIGPRPGREHEPAGSRRGHRSLGRMSTANGRPRTHSPGE